MSHAYMFKCTCGARGDCIHAMNYENYVHFRLEIHRALNGTGDLGSLVTKCANSYKLVHIVSKTAQFSSIETNLRLWDLADDCGKSTLVIHLDIHNRTDVFAHLIEKREMAWIVNGALFRRDGQILGAFSTKLIDFLTLDTHSPLIAHSPDPLAFKNVNLPRVIQELLVLERFDVLSMLKIQRVRDSTIRVLLSHAKVNSLKWLHARRLVTYIPFGLPRIDAQLFEWVQQNYPVQHVYDGDINTVEEAQILRKYNIERGGPIWRVHPRLWEFYSINPATFSCAIIAEVLTRFPRAFREICERRGRLGALNTEEIYAAASDKCAFVKATREIMPLSDVDAKIDRTLRGFQFELCAELIIAYK